MLNRLLEEMQKEPQRPRAARKRSIPRRRAAAARKARLKQAASSHGVIVKGEKQHARAPVPSAVTPLPGDDIVGYITRGRGVSVHRRDCVNMKDAGIEPDRMIEVSWENAGNTAYDAEIHLNGYDRAGLVGDLSLMFAKLGIPLDATSARKCEDGFTVTISMTLSIQNTQQLDNVLKQLRKRSDVIEVYRVSQ